MVNVWLTCQHVYEYAKMMLLCQHTKPTLCKCLRLFDIEKYCARCGSWRLSYCSSDL